MEFLIVVGIIVLADVLRYKINSSRFPNSKKWTRIFS